MEKRILEEVNRVREIMGLKLLVEAPGPKPKTFGGLLLSILSGEIGDISKRKAKQKIEQEYANIGKGTSRRETRQVADTIESWADEVKAGRATMDDFEKIVERYFVADEKIALIRNIAKSSTEVADNYIVAATMNDPKIYNNFADMIEQGATLTDPNIKDYIQRLAEANKTIYDSKMLETIWSDIESGQFKYADEAGITVPNRENIEGRKPNFDVDVENIVDITPSEAEIVIGSSDDVEIIQNVEEVAETKIREYLETDLRFKGASTKNKNKIIEQVRKNIKEKYPNEFKKFEAIGKKVEEIAEAAWDQKIKPSDKQEIIEKSFEELRITFQFNLDNLWKAFLRDLTLKDPTTGVYIWNSRNSLGKRFKNYLIMNSIVLAIESSIDYIDYLDENPDKWGDDQLERFNNFYNPAKVLRVLVPLPSIYTAILSKLVGTGILTPERRQPAKDELIKNSSLNKAFGNVEGNIITGLASTSPDMNGNTEYDKFALYISDSQGKNYGLWTYNTEKNEVEKYKDPVENAAIMEPAPNVTGKYEAKLDSFKKWLDDNGKKDKGTRGPDSHGVFQNGQIDYEFVDPNTGFKSTEKTYKE